ncbi:MAG TPA: DegV family protein [Candidatus Eremiobacteraceae bacterium]|nr:DegV family protein [Candidatus Eremiobacteraceae bacterium]
MSGRVAIVTDSTSDLGALAGQHGIEVVPLTIRFGNDEFRDGVDLSEADFYRKLEASPTTPITAQPTPALFAQTYRRLLDGGADRIISIHLPATLSGTINAAAIAANEIGDGKVDVLDSRSVSAGIGILALDAARRAAAGEDADAIGSALRADVPKVQLFATIPSLTYLARGGRIGQLSGLVGNVLKIVPILTMVDGTLKEHAKVRTFQKAVDQIVDIATARLSGTHGARVAVIHSMAPDLAQSVAGRISAAADLGSLYISTIGPTVGTHAGPGVVGTVFIV